MLTNAGHSIGSPALEPELEVKFHVKVALAQFVRNPGQLRDRHGDILGQTQADNENNDNDQGEESEKRESQLGDQLIYVSLVETHMNRSDAVDSLGNGYGDVIGHLFAELDRRTLLDSSGGTLLARRRDSGNGRVRV